MTSDERDIIVQLIPAESWHGLYYLESSPYFELRRLISFVLVQSPAGDHSIDAIDSGFVRCLGSLILKDPTGWVYPKFVHLVHDSEITDEKKELFAAEGQAQAASAARRRDDSEE